MTANYYPRKETTVYAHKTESLESSLDDAQTQMDSLPTLLPRSAWSSQVAFLRILFKAKKALDRIEQEVGVLKS